MSGEIIKTKEAKYREFLTIYRKYAKHLIIEKVKITEKEFYDFLGKAIKTELISREPSDIFINDVKIPYSYDELDYGSKLFPKKYENSPIVEPESTELQKAIRLYKERVVNKTLINGNK